MNPELLQAIQLSLVVATLATVGCAPVAIGLGTWFARRRTALLLALEAVVMAPLVLPPVVTGWFLLWLLGPHGAVGGVLSRWFGVDLPFTTAAAVIAAAVVALPLFVRSVRQGVEAVDPGLEQAARSLGASPWRTWREITLPLSMNGVLTGAVLAFARALGEFGATITFAGNIAGETRTIPLAVYRYAHIPGHGAQAAGLALVSLGIAVAALLASELLARRHR